MKKLLLVLLVVTLSALLLVACTPTTPSEGEGEGEVEEEICPNLNITSQVVFEGKPYIQGGKQTITVTFASPRESVYVYVDNTLKLYDNVTEVPMYPNADKTVYTGEFDFSTDVYNDYGDCKEGYIYVEALYSCIYPYILAYSPGLCKSQNIIIE